MAEVNLAAVLLGWRKTLTTVEHLLAKAVEHAKASDVSEADMLEWRLAPDMFPLRNQVQFVSNLTRQWGARAAGIDMPADAQGDCDVAMLRATIADAQVFLAQIPETLLQGRDRSDVTVNLGLVKPTLPLGQWITGFATTNIMFHTSILYAILRSRGAALGKADLFAGGL